MDTLSHALYGKGLFGYKKYRWYSFFFGIIPDIFSFGIYFIYLIVFSEFETNTGPMCTRCYAANSRKALLK